MRTLLSSSQRRGPEVLFWEIRTPRTQNSETLSLGVFTPVLAKHTKSFNLFDTLSVGVDRIQRNFEPLQRQVETWRKTQITDATAKLIFYSAFIEGKLEAPRSLLSEVHRLYFEPEDPEFSARTMWSLSNAFTRSAKVMTGRRERF
jgi:hypothetical protein